jgi:hypothetical protein
MVGKISFGEADSRPETTTPIQAGHRWASQKLAGWAFAKTAERKQRRESAGPVDYELGHAQERVKGGWAGLAPG